MEWSGGEQSGGDKGNGQAQNSNVLGGRPRAASGQQVVGRLSDPLEGEGSEGLELDAPLDLRDPCGGPKSCGPRPEKIGKWSSLFGINPKGKLTLPPVENISNIS